MTLVSHPSARISRDSSICLIIRGFKSHSKTSHFNNVPNTTEKYLSIHRQLRYIMHRVTYLAWVACIVNAFAQPARGAMVPNDVTVSTLFMIKTSKVFKAYTLHECCSSSKSSTATFSTRAHGYHGFRPSEINRLP